MVGSIGQIGTSCGCAEKGSQVQRKWLGVLETLPVEMHGLLQEAKKVESSLHLTIRYCWEDRSSSLQTTFLGLWCVPCLHVSQVSNKSITYVKGIRDWVEK